MRLALFTAVLGLAVSSTASAQSFDTTQFDLREFTPDALVGMLPTLPAPDQGARRTAVFFHGKGYVVHMPEEAEPKGMGVWDIHGTTVDADQITALIRQECAPDGGDIAGFFHLWNVSEFSALLNTEPDEGFATVLTDLRQFQPGEPLDAAFAMLNKAPNLRNGAYLICMPVSPAS